MDDTLTHFDFQLTPTCQDPAIGPALKILFKHEEPDIIIELGTGNGGMTKMLSAYAPDAKIHTFDIVPPGSFGPLPDNVTQHLLDVYTPAALHTILELLAKPCKVLLFCDGFDPAQEFNIYAPYLSVTDCILLHYQGDSNPDWLLHLEAGILSTVTDHNFIPNRQVLMSQAYWGSYKRYAATK